MIIRLHIKGFKNLKDVELYLGAFTCIAGANAVGKSNIFDAIQFLSALANRENSLLDAALSIRSEKERKRSAEFIRHMFYYDGKQWASTIEFEVDMILPQAGEDHLGQRTKPTTTLVKYCLTLGYREPKTAMDITQSHLEVLKEELLPLRKGEIRPLLESMGASKSWIDSVVTGRRQQSKPFIKTGPEEGVAYISQDQRSGQKRKLILTALPRTILSTATALETPTMLVAQQEMISWQLLQFEPSALRSPDNATFSEKPKITSKGDHLAATLYRLQQDPQIEYDVSGQVNRRLNELIEDVYEIDVDHDDKRDLLTLMVKRKNEVPFPARFLSDGSLRFIALSIIENDPEMLGVFCLEEPENGIHPERIPMILALLQEIACDTSEPMGADNPLRQIIINTHSPLIISETPESSLLFATPKSTSDKSLRLQPLKETWRNHLQSEALTITKGQLLKYLNLYKPLQKDEGKSKDRRVIDRAELNPLNWLSMLEQETQ